MKCLELSFVILFLICIDNVKSQNFSNRCTKLDSLKYVKLNVLGTNSGPVKIYVCFRGVNQTLDGEKWNRPDGYCPGPAVNNFVKIINAVVNVPKKRWGENVDAGRCAEECLKRINCLFFEMELEKCFLSEYLPSDDDIFRYKRGRFFFKRIYPSEEFIFLKQASIPYYDDLGGTEVKSIAECRNKCRSNPRCRSFETKPKCLACRSYYCDRSTANFPEYAIYSNVDRWDIYILNPNRNRNCTKADLGKYANMDFLDTNVESMATYKCLPSESAPEIEFGNEPDNAVGKYKNLASPAISCTDLLPYTCAKIKKCSFIRTDTEINISPRTLNGQNVSVFCEGMSTDFPKEYITLRKPTYFEVPLISNTTSCPRVGENGRRRYNKVRFLSEEMALDLNDKKFTTFEPFHHRKKMCLSKQNFTIDLRQTEFIISEKANWVTSGISANITSSQISKDKQVAVISCSGKCGICKSISPFPIPSCQAEIETQILPISWLSFALFWIQALSNTTAVVDVWFECTKPLNTEIRICQARR